VALDSFAKRGGGAEAGEAMLRHDRDPAVTFTRSALSARLRRRIAVVPHQIGRTSGKKVCKRAQALHDIGNTVARGVEG